MRQRILHVVFSAALAVVSASAVYVTQHLGDINFGKWGPALAAGITPLLHALLEYLDSVNK